jgi:cell wall-associated NlpC family hydrolase
MIPRWVNKFVGIAYLPHGRELATGLDCWGLLRLALHDRWGIDLPSYDDYGDPTQPAQVGPYLTTCIEGCWLPVPAGTELAGDVALLRIGEHPTHVGLVVAPGQMLHVFDRAASCVERYDGPKWGNRLVAFYRHEKLAGLSVVTEGGDQAATRQGSQNLDQIRNCHE